MPDMHRISKKFHRGGAGLQEVVKVYQAIEKVGLETVLRITR